MNHAEMKGKRKNVFSLKCLPIHNNNTKLDSFLWLVAIFSTFFLLPTNSSLQLDEEIVMTKMLESVQNMTSNRTKFYAVDIYTLEKLAKKELEVIKTFVNNPETTRQSPVIKTINKYLRAFTTATNMRIKGGVDWTEASMLEDMTKIADNPIAAFSLIHRTHKYWTRIFNSSTNSSGQMRNETELDEKFKTRDENKEPTFPQVTEWPVDEDLQESVNALIMTVFTYELDVTQFAQGNISGRETGAQLNSEQCALVAETADAFEHPAQAVEWQELAISLKKKESPGKSTKSLEKMLRKYEFRHDTEFAPEIEETPHFFEKLTLVYEACKQNSFYGPCVPRRRIRQRCPPLLPEYDAKLYDCHQVSLCNGRNYQTNEQKSKLFCWYESARHPYFRIGPIRMEFLSIDPDVVQMYDVITDKMLDHLLALASTRYLKATSQFGGNGTVAGRDNSYDSGRNAMYSWLRDTNQTLGLIEIPKMIGMLTGFDVVSPRSSEWLQVASYTFSGYFVHHKDAFGGGNYSDQLVMGDRIATFMYYLSDVTEGGLTAFVGAGVAARPIKKSAVFWYNHFGNGEIDWRLRHAACPILFGRKIVANKWIRSFRQAFNHPTPLDPKDAFRILVNGKTPPSNSVTMNIIPTEEVCDGK